MTWSYSGNPGYSGKDQVRFLVGDTDKTDQLLTDAEIEWTLQRYNNAPMNAAIRCCESILSKFARMVDESVGEVKISFSQRMKSYAMTLTMLKSRLATEDTSFYAGGISKSDKRAQEQNSDRVKPDFRKHMMENEQIAPWTTQSLVDIFLLNDEG